MEKNRGLMHQGFCGMIHLYQYCISPCIRPSCRFYPSCSQYMLDALQQRGILQGLWAGTKRLLRCHPWSPGGYDPIRPNNEKY